MTLVDAIAEAKAIDGRAIAGVVPPLEDTLRAFEQGAANGDGEETRRRKRTAT